MDTLIGLLLVATGTMIALLGLKVFFAVLPMLGFFFGFFTGAAFIHNVMDGHPFLATVTGAIVGVAFGVVCAFLAWYWWYAGVLLSAGMLGALLGTALSRPFTLDSEFAYVAFGVVGFIALISAAYVLNLPIYVIMVNTAGVGASVLATGLMLVFDALDRQDLGHGVTAAILDGSWWWGTVWLVLAVAGIAVQLTAKELARLPEQPWETARSGA